VLKFGLSEYADLDCKCTTMDNALVAHYDLKPSNVRTYDVSGNNLIIYEAFAHMCAGMILCRKL
jgi:hypothetical protein